MNIVYTTKPDTAFSFFNQVFINLADMSAEELEQVIAHEICHVKMHHSVDMLIAGLMRITFWWNPAVWLWHRSLREVHEYQVDAAVLAGGFDHISYIQLIIQRFTDIHPEFVSGFSYSLIKKRLVMITKKTSGRLSKLRILTALPAIAALMILFSFTTRTPQSATNKDEVAALTDLAAKDKDQGTGASVIVSDRLSERSDGDIRRPTEETQSRRDGDAGQQDKISNNSQSSQTSSQASTALNYDPHEVPILKSEKMPVFQGRGVPEFRNWVMARLVYPTEVLDEKVEGVVTVSFVVTTTGEVGEIEVLSTPHELLAKEVTRVIRLSPKWTPGLQKGDPQAVKIILPIRFEILKDDPAAPVPPIPANNIQDEPLTQVEQMPYFGDGSNPLAFQHWVMSRIQYPADAAENNIQGMVLISFTVNKEGNVRDVKVQRSPNPLLSEAAMKVVENSPRWTPGYNNGQPVNVQMTTPVRFQLQE